MDGPKHLNLIAYTDAGLYAKVRVLTEALAPQDLTGWELHASAVTSVLDAAEAVPMTASAPTPANGEIVTQITESNLAALFPAGDTSVSKTVYWTLLAKPYGTYKVKLFYGKLTVKRGAGRWT